MNLVNSIEFNSFYARSTVPKYCTSGCSQTCGLVNTIPRYHPFEKFAKRMSQVESVSLSDSLLPRVKVHATVVFSILNSFTRRTPRDSRVVGTLLGEVRDGVVVVS
jgi:hypothetical protein